MPIVLTQILDDNLNQKDWVIPAEVDGRLKTLQYHMLVMQFVIPKLLPTLHTAQIQK